ncbi:tyrosine-type recombinase/integrase [Cytobacillus purgationiresistens]|uniref:Integrase n=1 Tax=Cytobacillus purgationiresistens TaxID=863449 RepID=A0ABU0ANA8_9BACI|nr:tyrosine-type recombinase/integrase [Cytobacillus purgationiresistens]MDQ0271878.1 integrase [Cytobacillus purgationiresistens]
MPEDKKISDRRHNREGKIKYIPDDIWNQVLDHLELLPKKFVPILIVLEASGFRVSDVVSLKLDCLLKQQDGWWLVGDQSKVKYKSHKVPISEEVAKTIIAQQKLTKQLSNQINNPNNYLFPTLSGVRVGNPISPNTLSRNLNKLAQECEIRDQNGEIYFLKNMGSAIGME